MAYRFTGGTNEIRFAATPLVGTLGAQTVATLLKMNNGGTDRYGVTIVDNGMSTIRHCVRFTGGTNPSLVTNDSASSTNNTGLGLSSTAVWYLVVVTWAGSGAARFHIHNGTSWTHVDANNGAAANTTVGSTDRIYVPVPGTWGGIGVIADIVCTGIKKANSTDAQVEALTPTAFQTWRDFAFHWLIGFDPSLETAGVLQDQGGSGTGDEVSRSGTSIAVVADPPSFAWTSAPPEPPVTGSGKFSKIRFGPGLVVTDEGGGVITVDVA